ncbi:Panacea domain-containing protein [Pedosphaera parvula]|uniref:Antitoxin SocA-like Panacea domain-containing protein n=1 Tax=Pedosphaera parvula (strain Ellin514) TaxID=320771 RepID=B9XEE4_PEDPL|nr:Panacea domain-containing protein [Pedosphaera parvula]EEF61658.1 conserved hypothetical protein [Pedosphaera parvula Ellin514]
MNKTVTYTHSMRITPPAFNGDRVKAENLIIYVCQKMENCPGFGAILLNKVLYYIDHVHYLKHGKKLTGFKYIKQRLGPTPKPSEFLPIRESLIDNEKINEKPVEFFGRVQKRLSALTEPDLKGFTVDEISLIDNVISALSPFNGKAISDVTHEELSWKFAGMMEELPDYAYLLTEAPLNEDDLTWARKTITEYAGNVR